MVAASFTDRAKPCEECAVREKLWKQASLAHADALYGELPRRRSAEDTAQCLKAVYELLKIHSSNCEHAPWEYKVLP